MSMEKSRSSIDGSWLRENETREFRYGYEKENDYMTDYQKVVKMLAEFKSEHELMFNGMLEHQLRELQMNGVSVTKDQLMRDINVESTIRSTLFDLDKEEDLPKIDTPTLEDEIDLKMKHMKDNLASIFEYKEKPKAPDKDTLIQEILRKMADAGEFSYIPLEDISQRIDTMNIVKKRLQEKSIDELEILVNSYSQEELASTGRHR